MFFVESLVKSAFSVCSIFASFFWILLYLGGGTLTSLNVLGTCAHNVMVFSTYVMRWIVSTFLKLNNVSKSDYVLFVLQLSSLENLHLKFLFHFR